MRCQEGRAALAATALLLAAGAVTPGRGQEAIRMSIASAQAAEARRRAAETVGYYNLRWGPTAWRFGAGLGVDYNSNVNYTEDNPQPDFIFRPQILTRHPHLIMQTPTTAQIRTAIEVLKKYCEHINHNAAHLIVELPETRLGDHEAARAKVVSIEQITRIQTVTAQL